MPIQTQLRRFVMYELLLLRGAIGLMDEVVSSPLSESKKEDMLELMVREILEYLPSDIFAVRIGNFLFGDKSSAQSEIWDLSQIKEFVQSEVTKELGL